MKYKYLAYTFLLALTSTLTQAQVKIGNNPTTITPGALLDIEGSTATIRTVSLPNGNFGIGTTAPVAKLDVGGNIGFSSDLTNGQLAGVSKTLFLIEGTNGLQINNNANNLNHMVITNTGNVGIGTPLPVAKLDVGGNIGFASNLGNGQLVGVSNTLLFIEGTNGLQINNNANNLNHMVITNTGNVGIGTPLPVAKLDVGGNIGFASNLGNGQLVGVSNTLLFIEGTNGLQINNNANNLNHMVITNTGNVGIGTPLPVAKLDVGGNIGFASNLGNGQLVGVSNTLLFIEGTNGLQINNNANNLNHMVITSAGNIGISTPSPVAKLDIVGNVRIADGTQGTGKILTSDGNGVASWQSLQGLNIPKVVFAGRSSVDFYFNPLVRFYPQINPIFSAPGYNASNNTFTIQEAGFYRITGGAEFNGTSEVAGASVRVYIAGDNLPDSFHQFDDISTGQFPALSTFWDGYFPAGSRINMSVFSLGAHPQQVRVLGGTAFLTIMKIY